MSPPASKLQPSDGWTLAVALTAQWLREPCRVDWLLEKQASGLAGGDRARCQELLSGAVRHHGRIEAALSPLLRRVPKPKLRAILHIAAAEIVENTAAAPEAIVDYAVGRTQELCSKAESGMVNAVLRKAAPLLRAEAPDPAAATPAGLAEHYSHPEWLVVRWMAQFGREATVRLLAWDQTAAGVHLRLSPGVTAPEFLESTPWGGFFRLKPGHWADAVALIEAGKAYVQDPATRIASEALEATPRCAVLDLCAAPGGKSLQLAERVGKGGCVVCVERPGPRIIRLEQNVGRFRTANPDGARVEVVAADLLKLTAPVFEARSLPSAYRFVLLDAPCSNTGVLRHRVDARWRLKPGDPVAQAAVQIKLLRAAATLVTPGGKLVYSTCSLEKEENAGVIEAFLASDEAGFTLAKAIESRPWETGHDGAGVFVLQRA